MTFGNIEIERDHDHYVMFRTTCDCGSNDHAVRVIVDLVGDIAVMASLYYECGWMDLYSDPWWKKMLRRLKDAAKILFKGRLFLDEEFIFRSDGHLDDFIQALQEASEKMKKVQAERLKAVDKSKQSC